MRGSGAGEGPRGRRSAVASVARRALVAAGIAFGAVGVVSAVFSPDVRANGGGPTPITVSASSDTKTYDGNTSSTSEPYISEGNLADPGMDTIDCTQVFASATVGIRTLSVVPGSCVIRDGASQDVTSNYTIGYATASGEILPSQLTPVIVANDKTYDGTNAATLTGGCTLSGFIVDGEVVFCDTTGATATFSSATAGNGKIVTLSPVALGGANKENYSLATTSATDTADISLREISVKAQTQTKTYDDTTTSSGTPFLSAGSLATGHSLSGCTQAFDSTAAGAKTITPANCSVLDGSSNDVSANYSIGYVGESGTISLREITVKAQADTKTYDATTTSSGTPYVSVGSLVSGHQLSGCTQVFDSPYSSAFRSLSVSGCSVYDGMTNETANYDISYDPTAGTIDDREIEISAVSGTKPYDGTTSSSGAPTISTGTLAPGDALTGCTQSYATASAGPSKTLSVDPGSCLLRDGSSNDVSGNYQVSYATASGAIDKVTITVTVTGYQTYGTDSATFTKGADDAPTGITVSGTISCTDLDDGGDIPSTQLDVFYGPYTIGGSSCSGANPSDATNYEIVYTGSTYTVNPANFVLTVTGSQTFGITSDVTFDATYTPVAKVVVNEAGLTCFALDDNTPIPSIDLPVGIYNPINAASCSGASLSGDASGNYTPAYAAGAYTVNAAATATALTVTAETDTKPWDGTTTSDGVPSVTSGTLASGHSLSGCTQTFDSATVSASAGDKTLTASGCSVMDGMMDVSSNYDIDYATATGTITAATGAMIQYTGDTYLPSAGTASLRAQLTGPSACLAAQTVSFRFDSNGDGTYGGAGDVGATPTLTATSDGGGVATATYGVSSGTPGPLYEIEVSVDAGNCNAAINTGVLVVAGSGDASNGGGWYKSLTPGVGRINFGYTVQVKTGARTIVAGQITWHTTGAAKVRFKGTVTAYTKTCPTWVTGTIPSGLCGYLSGTGSLYSWTGSGWQLTASGIGFRVVVFDGGSSVSCNKKTSCTSVLKPDHFLMDLPTATVAGESTAAIQLSGGNLVVR